MAESKQETYYYKRPSIKSKSQYNGEADKIANDSKKAILEGVTRAPHTNDYDHSSILCECTKGGRTEKRWCRCLVNFGNGKKATNCSDCVLRNVYGKPVENAVFLDFEIPVSQNSKDMIGEIDVVLEYEGEKYYTEVKPDWNDESLLRMVAEIVTYCYVSGYDDWNKAIMFTKGSEQYRQWTGIKNGKKYNFAANDSMRKIIKDNNITVFCIEDVGDRYRLEKMN